MSFYLKAETIYVQDSPFIFSFCEEVVDQYHNIPLPRTSSYRSHMLENNSRLQITNIGRESKILSKSKVKISEIAKSASSQFEKCQLLVSIAQWSNSKRILELGTNLGIATHAFGEANLEVHSVEGNVDLFNHSNSSLSIFDNIKCSHALFFDFLSQNTEKYDLIYIDGDHSYDSSKKLISLASKFLTPNGIIIIDDIRWSSEMKKIWMESATSDLFNIAIDLFALGLLSKNEVIKSPLSKILIPKKYKPWPYHFFRS